MNKGDLIKAVSETTELSKKDVETVVNSVFDAISGALVADDNVNINGFGAFSVVKTAERKGRNPQTNSELIIPAGRKPKFKPGKQLKEIVK